jgi:acetylornithine deacetylase
VVAEPTACEAVLGHRGILSVESRFHGTPGHSSEARALHDNAVHQMSRWASGALDVAAQMVTPQNQPGSCFNLGFVEGGTASNVIAGEAAMKWSARLRPGSSNRAFLEEIRACVPAEARIDWDVQFAGEPLPATEQNDEEAREFAARKGLAIAANVDFWTEAAIFSEFGLPALVLGPGHIEQAHIADEWVALAQLDRACELYGEIINGDR